VTTEDAGLEDSVSAEDVDKVLINSFEGKVADEDGSLGWLTFGDGALTTATSTTATSSATVVRAALAFRALLTRSTRAGWLDLEGTTIELGTLQGGESLLGIGFVLEGHEAITKGAGTTEHNLAFGTIKIH
jgi:hypothetical protein